MESVNASTVKEIERIVKENLVQQIQVGDRTFVTNDRLTEVKPYKPTAARLTFSDLSSIVQIAKERKTDLIFRSTSISRTKQGCLL